MTKGPASMAPLPDDRIADVLIDVRRDGAMAVMPPGLVRAGLICSDIAVLAVAALIANWIRFGHPFAFDRLMLVMMIGLPIMILISEMVGIYRPQAASQPARGLLRWMAAWSAALGIVIAALFFTKTGDAFSRLWVGYWYVAVLVLIMPVRLALSGVLRQREERGPIGEYLGIVGSQDVLDRMLLASHTRISPGIVFVDRRATPRDAVPEAVLRQLARLNRLILTFGPD